MSRNKYVNPGLDKFRKPAEGNAAQADKEPSESPRSAGSAATSPLSVTDKEWKKAVFRRWDEFRALRRDVLLKLNTELQSVPVQTTAAEKQLKALNLAENKLKHLIEQLEQIDDSTWERKTLNSELGVAMKNVENARMEWMLIRERISEQRTEQPAASSGLTQAASPVKDLLSLSFAQCFRLGLAFFLPLIIGIVLGACLLAIFNYLAMI